MWFWRSSEIIKKQVKIHASIGSQDIFIESDVVDSDIPMLLSKSAMKKANTTIDFQSDRVTMLEQKQQVIITTSGHYAIPSGNNQQILKYSKGSPDKTQITLLSRNIDLMNDKTAHKLRSQFSHPASELVNSAGLSDDQEHNNQMCEVLKNCEICEVYRRPSPRLVVGFPLATEFNDVAMELKQCEGGWILHLIEHVSGYSAAAVIKSKRKKNDYRTLIQDMGKCLWRSIKFESFGDNGGEFNNEEFREMCETMNIIVKTTAAEAP